MERQPDSPGPSHKGLSKPEKETVMQAEIWVRSFAFYYPDFHSAGCFREILSFVSAEYAFMGSLIIREVYKDLAPRGMKQAKVV